MSSFVLTNSQLETIFSGLNALDGIHAEHFIPFNFDADTTWLIAENLVAVQRALESLRLSRKLIAGKYGLREGEKVTKENQERVAGFLAEVDEIYAKSVTVEGLKKIPRAKIDLAKNKVLPSTLAKIQPILE